MKSLIRTALIAAATLAATSAQSGGITQVTDGHTVYHRPGADMAAHDKALDNCISQAATTNQGMRGPSFFTAFAFGIVGSAIEAKHNKERDPLVQDRGYAANVENCMVATGWSVVVLDKSQGAAIAKLPAAAQREKLATLVGAATPPGQVARRFDNPIVRADSRWLVEPGEFYNLPLDLRARAYDGWGAVRAAARKPAEPAPPPQSVIPFAQPTGEPAYGPAQWNTIPAGKTAVVIKVRRFVPSHTEAKLLFAREGSNSDYPAWHEDGKIDTMWVSFGAGRDVKDRTQTEGVAVLPLPPGRWRLMGVLNGRVITSFCFGAPSFVLEEGQILYLGQFDYGRSPQMVPDTSLNTLARELAPAPGLRDRLKSAEWVNGSLFRCDGSYITAFEIPGRGYRPGYVNGSAAP